MKSVDWVEWSEDITPPSSDRQEVNFQLASGKMTLTDTLLRTENQSNQDGKTEKHEYLRILKLTMNCMELLQKVCFRTEDVKSTSRTWDTFTANKTSASEILFKYNSKQ